MEDVFVAVTGATPQIITESLYDFVVQQKLDISELHIITTAHGKEKCEQLLFGTGGHFYRFCNDFDLQAYTIKIAIHAITDGKGRTIGDIRTVHENNQAADFIHRTIAELCSRDKIRILASMAGGRKTMSAYMAYAMQFYARPQDKLFHVLIAPQDLEFNPNFFYPPPGETSMLKLAGRDGADLEIPVGQIKIQNAEIPFIRLRDKLTFTADMGPMEYSELVKITQGELDKVLVPQVIFTAAEGRVRVTWHDKEWNIHLKPMDFVVYEYLLTREKKRFENTGDARHSSALQNLYARNRPGHGDMPLFDKQDLVDARARINKALKDAISNPHILKHLLIHSRQKNRIPTYYMHY